MTDFCKCLSTYDHGESFLFGPIFEAVVNKKGHSLFSASFFANEWLHVACRLLPFDDESSVGFAEGFVFQFLLIVKNVPLLHPVYEKLNQSSVSFV